MRPGHQQPAPERVIGLVALLALVFAIVGVASTARWTLAWYDWSAYAAEGHCTEVGQRWVDYSKGTELRVIAFTGSVYLCNGPGEGDVLVVR